MPRYIDADKLPITTVAIQPYALIEKPYNAEVVFAQAIKAAPTADVREVVHAHYEKDNDGYMFCTNCGNFAGFFDYCPFCGAMIDESSYGEEKIE